MMRRWHFFGVLGTAIALLLLPSVTMSLDIWGNVRKVRAMSDTFQFKFGIPVADVWERGDSSATLVAFEHCTLGVCTCYATYQTKYNDYPVAVDSVDTIVSTPCSTYVVTGYRTRGYALGGPNNRLNDIWALHAHITELDVGSITIDTVIYTVVDTANVARNALKLGGLLPESYLRSNACDTFYLLYGSKAIIDTLIVDYLIGTISHADSADIALWADSAYYAITWAGYSWGDRYPYTRYSDTAGIALVGYVVWCDTSWWAVVADTAIYAKSAKFCTTAQNSYQWDGHAWGTLYPHADTANWAWNVIGANIDTAKVLSERAGWPGHCIPAWLDTIHGCSEIVVDANASKFRGNVDIDSVLGLEEYRIWGKGSGGLHFWWSGATCWAEYIFEGDTCNGIRNKNTKLEVRGKGGWTLDAYQVAVDSNVALISCGQGYIAYIDGPHGIDNDTIMVIIPGSNKKVKVFGDLELDKGLKDHSGNYGTSGQVLISEAGDSVRWGTVAGGGGDTAKVVTGKAGYTGNYISSWLKGDSMHTDRWLNSENNTFLGIGVCGAGNLAHGSGSRGWYNTFSGCSVGYSNTTGNCNTFSGYQAGYSNTAGYRNVFIGNKPGYSNTGGDYNIFLGDNAGYSNTTGGNNVFLGQNAGHDNTTAHSNIFIAKHAGYKNTTGSRNVFVGGFAGYTNTVGDSNVFMGNYAGHWNTTGSRNVFLGDGAGYHGQTGSYNTFLGYDAGRSYSILPPTGSYNTFLGARAGYLNRGGDSSIYIGFEAGYHDTLSNRFYVANRKYADITGARHHSIAYGVMADSAKNQTLMLNAAVTTKHDFVCSTNITAVGKFIGDSDTFDVLRTYSQTIAHDTMEVGRANMSDSIQAHLDEIRDTTIAVSQTKWNITYAESSLYADSSGWANLADSALAIDTTNAGFTTYVGNHAGGGGGGGDTAKVVTGKAGYAGNYISSWLKPDSFHSDRWQNKESNTFLGMGVCGAGNLASAGHSNSFFGCQTGYENTVGRFCTFLGNMAGRGNTTGLQNTFTGYGAGYANTTGNDNTFTGVASGMKNTEGNYNTFTGLEAGRSNTTGSSNVFTGKTAGWSHITGDENVFTGYGVGYNNTTGDNNVFTGAAAGMNCATGNCNTFVGSYAGYADTTADSSICIGYKAGYHETESNYFIVDNQNRGSKANGRLRSIIVGQMAHSPANQTLMLNAAVTSKHDFVCSTNITVCDTIKTDSDDMVFLSDSMEFQSDDYWYVQANQMIEGDAATHSVRPSAQYVRVWGQGHDSVTASYSTVWGWDNNYISGDYATVWGSIHDSITGLNATVWGVDNDKITGNYTTVWGEDNDNITGLGTTVWGWQNKNILDMYTTVWGAMHDSITGQVVTVWGIGNDHIGGTGTTVWGNSHNYISGEYSTVWGWDNDNITGHWATVWGVGNDSISGLNATVWGNNNNNVLGEGATVSGWQNNHITGDYATVWGVGNDSMTGDNATVWGSGNDYVSGMHATVWGHGNDSISGQGATVWGHQHDKVTADYATVWGWENNYISGDFATVWGWENNYISGMMATVWGNRNDSILGEGATVWGKGNRIDSCMYSTAFGINAIIRGTALDSCCFITGTGVIDSASYATIINADGDDTLSISHHTLIGTDMTVDGSISGLEKSADPTEPAEGTYVIWMSDGTGKGDDGDVLIASQAGGVTKWGTIFDHSGGNAW